MLARAERFMESQGFHLMTKEEIPKFARCAVESYGSISYALNDYFVGHPCTKDELLEMWSFNLKYFYSRALIYSDSPDCNAWLLWIPPGCEGASMINFIRYGGFRMAIKLGLPAMKRIMHYEDYSVRVRPVYLETHSEKNVMIYRHFGTSSIAEREGASSRELHPLNIS